jgi:hypothetical protein
MPNGPSGSQPQRSCRGESHGISRVIGLPGSLAWRSMWVAELAIQLNVVLEESAWVV